MSSPTTKYSPLHSVAPVDLDQEKAHNAANIRNAQNAHTERRRQMYIWIGVAAFIIVVTAIVGGVLGSIAAKYKAPPPSENGLHTSTVTPSFKAANNSAVALTQPRVDPSYTYAYAQLENGSIIETTWSGGEWQYNKSSVVVQDALKGGAIAADTYQNDDFFYKALAYFSPNGTVMFMTNTSAIFNPDGTVKNMTNTSDSTWTTPMSVSPSNMTSNGQTLALCHTPYQNPPDLYLFYQPTHVVNAGLTAYTLPGANISKPWKSSFELSNIQAEGAAACTMGDRVGNFFMQVDGSIHQTSWNLGEGRKDKGPIELSRDMVNGSDISLWQDFSSKTTHIFYQANNGTIIRRPMAEDPYLTLLQPESTWGTIDKGTRFAIGGATAPRHTPSSLDSTMTLFKNNNEGRYNITLYADDGLTAAQTLEIGRFG